LHLTITIHQQLPCAFENLDSMLRQFKNVVGTQLEMNFSSTNAQTMNARC